MINLIYHNHYKFNNYIISKFPNFKFTFYRDECEFRNSSGYEIYYVQL